ncbi:MAG: Sapep family Mn(2+)-dependent dipeptidase [Erysipelotrichaceae bacterium]|nr:Sapep family Mn(2+)-dependent dipeptidase [Erysipelotrichaceae bacterium]
MTDMKELYAYIDSEKDNIINDLKRLAAIESVSLSDHEVKPFGPGCLKVLNEALSMGEAEGFKPHNYDNYVGSVKYDVGKEESIGILAHLDVVPAGDDWTITEPYNPIIKDDYLFGRGTGDDKSGAIAGLYIMKALRKYNVELNHNIDLLLGTNEEVGMRDVEYYAAHYPTPKFTFVPDGGFPGSAGEFGRLRYVLTSEKALSDDFVDMFAGSAFNIVPNKATVILKKDTAIDYHTLPEAFEVKETDNGISITAFGVTTHAAGPERGVNAIKVLTSELVKLNGINPDDLAILTFLDNVNQDYYGTFLGIDNIDEISGQTVSSGTVLRFNGGHVSLLNDCRYCVSDNGDRLEENVRAKAAEYGFATKVEEKTYGAHIDPNGPIVTKVKEVYQAYTGDMEKNIVIGKGGTYAGCLKNAFATGSMFKPEDKAPSYLPAGHGGAHQPDEYIYIPGYIDGIKLLMTMIIEVDKIL